MIVISTCLTSLLIWIFGSLEQDFVTEYVEQVTAYLKSFSQADIDQLGKDTYERNLAGLPATNIATLAFTYFIHGLVLGFFVNIVLSVIVRRHPKTA